MVITESVLLYISVNDVVPNSKATYPNVEKLTEHFLKEKALSKEELQKILQAYVLAGTDLRMMQRLIDHGADVNYSYVGGDKLLRMAHENPAVTKLLIKNSASLTGLEQQFFKDIDPNFAKSEAFMHASMQHNSNALSKPEIS